VILITWVIKNPKDFQTPQKLNRFFYFLFQSSLTKTNMSSISSNGVICVFEYGVYLRIVSLPTELQTVNDIKEFIETTLVIARVGDVQIVNKTTPSGVRYRSATVWLSEWRITGYAQDFRRAMIANGEAGVCIDRAQHVAEDGEIIDQPFDFHFDNGKLMYHIKMIYGKIKAPEPVVSTKSLNLGSAWSSIYIPVVFDDYCQEDRLKSLFENDLGVGKVSRVDYVSKTDGDSSFVSAYVHFDQWFDNTIVSNIRQTINQKGAYKCYTPNGLARFDNGRHLSFKVNTKPISTVVDTTLNVHQLADANASLQKKIAELEAELAALKSVAV
jgi:hypothetical protein